jgi:hypothetical protein
VRRDEQPIDLFVGGIGQREHDPVGSAGRVFGRNSYAPDDPIGPGRRGNLDPFALVEITLDGPSQIDRRRVERQSEGLHRHGLPAKEHRCDRQGNALEDVSGAQRATSAAIVHEPVMPAACVHKPAAYGANVALGRLREEAPAGSRQGRGSSDRSAKTM